MKFGLENISHVCAELGHPERTFRPVIIAGTNGKGSVAAMVHRGLRAAGHPAGRYTSPHLERLEERFVMGDREVTAAELDSAARAVRAAADALLDAGRLAAPPTFFEATTAIAFEIFRRADVSIAVLEVGLGGRLDATNVAEPVAAAITSIDFDHQAQLGRTLGAIALEKAGVIRRSIPVVCGEMAPIAEQVIREVCGRVQARWRPAAACVSLEAITEGQPLALRGAHQRGNALVAACLLQELDAMGIPVGTAAIRSALLDVHWPGRLELIRYQGAEVLLDAAHNPAGARALGAYLQELGWHDAVLVYGVAEDKDAAAMLAALAPLCRDIVCTTPLTSRAAAPAAVADLARAAGVWRVTVEPDPRVALARAAALNPRIVIAGSIFLIGPLRGILRG